MSYGKAVGTYSLGIDVGAETVAFATVRGGDDALEVVQRSAQPHHKDPHGAVRRLLAGLDLSAVRGVAATGRLQRVLNVAPVPTKAALRRGIRVAYPDLAGVTVLSIGAHGFSVLELHDSGQEWFQQNSRCSQGTGNFLSQLVKRFGLDIEEASLLCDYEQHPAPLSGRCPVILKTDMTHLANKGEERSRILAGLYDAVCENVVTLVRPRLAPPDVLLVGGVAKSARIRRQIAAWLEQRGMCLRESSPLDEYVEAIGAATHALEHCSQSPELVQSVDDLLGTAVGTQLERVPSLRQSLPQVRRMARLDLPTRWGAPRSVLLGLDIGSTGSKAVAIDAQTGECVWETYANTEGAPVRAAQGLMARWRADHDADGRILGLGVTGSGREIVGSLLRTCYGADRVFILNEIAAHARGATSLDSEVDTIFEIGGQDAKYIRLEQGRVIDAAMNEACSAGTGSFIAEQGEKFDGIGPDPQRLGEIAIGAEYGVSLGQHCSVFMAEVIDEAITQGSPASAIVAGLYDSIIQNYLNRVKGTRTVGSRIFCQGMPFSSDALAAAVARQTGRPVVVPPNPGTIGALGIALLLRDEKLSSLSPEAAADPRVFLDAEVSAKETFVCRSTKGCGGGGNLCRIDRLTTVVDGVRQRFLWGGNCSLYDRGGGREKLPDLAPNPFQQREALVEALMSQPRTEPGSPRGTIAMTDEFSLKGLAPLFIVFLRELGFDVSVTRHATSATLRRGVEGARIPFCAPMQLIHGVAFEMAETAADYLLLPMVKALPRVGDEEFGELCPVVLGSPDIVGGVLPEGAPRQLTPIVDFDADGYSGRAFRDSMRNLAEQLGASDRQDRALRVAVRAQLDFEAECRRIGRQALDFSDEHGVVPVAVLGRPYTIYNDVLNSNVPNLLRSLGALAIPVDCLPVSEHVPLFRDQYWGYTQRNLRAAEQVRHTPGLYSVFCSNYACGPDSFTLHFYGYVMQGKPFAVVETDGHSGDAGTKTRLEAFLYCVDTDRRSGASLQTECADFGSLDRYTISLQETRRRQTTMLIPRMGPQAKTAAAALRADGFKVEPLPLSTREDVRAGRRYTSGKECVPMMLTLGTLLNRLERSTDPDERFTLFMPTAHGPCRFGVYHSMHKIALERAGWADRVTVVSPSDKDYFEEMSNDFSLRLWLGFVVHDLLGQMLYDVRPVETRPGAAKALYDRYEAEHLANLERPSNGTTLSLLRELVGGMWGMRRLLKAAARDFAAIKDAEREVPTVGVVGEIYARLDPFANDFVIDKLEERGVRVQFAPFYEWLEYTTRMAEDRLARRRPAIGDEPLQILLSGVVQRASAEMLYAICAGPLGWGARTSVAHTLEAAREYLHPDLQGEAALTLGGPIHEYLGGRISGVVIVGPHECMPCKVAEAQYGEVAEDLGIPYLSIAVNGDPIDTELLDRFCYDIREFSQRPAGARALNKPVLGTDLPVSGRRRVSLPVLNPALVAASEAADERRARAQSAG